MQSIPQVDLTVESLPSLYPAHLRVGVYRITMEALDRVELADFSAATLRGAFGWSFKRMVCFQPQVKSCDGCLLWGQCPYPPVFEPRPDGGSVYAGGKDAPSPYVLRPPEGGKRSFGVGERFSFEVVLVGKAIGFLPYFAVALQQLEESGLGRKRGRVRVTRIEDPLLTSPRLGEGLSRDAQGDGILFDEGEPEVIHSHAGWAAGEWISAQPVPEEVTVHFSTLTRLKSEGKMQTEPAFHVLYRALLRRVSALCSAHTDVPWETEFAHLAELARGVEVENSMMQAGSRHRRSDRQERRVEMRGTQGIMVYRGDLAPFWPLLQLGQVLHVGKSCTFGLGQYRLLTQPV